MYSYVCQWYIHLIIQLFHFNPFLFDHLRYEFIFSLQVSQFYKQSLIGGFIYRFGHQRCLSLSKGHSNIGIILLRIGNSHWYLYHIQSKSDRLFNAQSRVLQAWLILENNEKATFNINNNITTIICYRHIELIWTVK